MCELDKGVMNERYFAFLRQNNCWIIGRVLYLYAKFNNNYLASTPSRSNFSLTKHKRLDIWLHVIANHQFVNLKESNISLI